MKIEKLSERVAFDKRATLAEPGNGSGTKRADWVEQFERWAAVQFLTGGETVTASRLGGISPAVITVRNDSATKDITAAWRARHLRTGKIYNIKAATPSPDLETLSFLSETGENSG